MSSDSKRTVKSVSCTCFNLRTSPSKHYAYEIHVKWSNGQSAVVYRRYSQFFNLQCTLLETFEYEAGTYDPSKRTIPFLPGKKLMGNLSEKTAEKRRNKFDTYLKTLITLPRVVSSDVVLKFFESKESDLASLIDHRSSKRKNQLSLKGHEITGPIAYPQYVVIDDYTKAQNGELSVAAGTILYIIEKKHTGWWLAQVQDGDSQGWVPASYLDPVYSAAGGESSEEDEFSVLPAEPVKYVTTSDYVAAEGDELSVARACVVEVITTNIDGWWKCRYGGKEGLFPAAYLRKANTLKAKELLAMAHQQSVRSDVASAPAHPFSRPTELSHYAPPRRDQSKPKPPRPPTRPSRTPARTEYVAIADFTNTMYDGIDLQEGASMQVLTKDDSGWWYVQTGGTKGWAPSSYLQLVTTSHAPDSVKPLTESTKARSQSPADSSKAKPRPPARPQKPPGASPKVNSKFSHQTNPTHVLRGETPHVRPRTGPISSQSTAQGATTNKPAPYKPAVSAKPVFKQRQDSQVSAASASDSNETQNGQVSVAELRQRLAANFLR